MDHTFGLTARSLDHFSPSLPGLIVSKAFLDLFFPVKTQVKFEEKTRQEIFKEEKTNGRLTVREKVGQVFCVLKVIQEHNQEMPLDSKNIIEI